MNHYLNVFLEAFYTASLIPFASESTLSAMKAFGGYNLPLAVALAVIGGVMGQTINLTLGHVLRRLRKPGGWNIPEPRYQKAQRLFYSYGLFIYLVCWLAFGNLVVVISGFLNIRPKTALPLILLGYAAHYGALLV